MARLTQVVLYANLLELFPQPSEHVKMQKALLEHPCGADLDVGACTDHDNDLRFDTHVWCRECDTELFKEHYPDYEMWQWFETGHG